MQSMLWQSGFRNILIYFLSFFFGWGMGRGRGGYYTMQLQELQELGVIPFNLLVKMTILYNSKTIFIQPLLKYHRSRKSRREK